MTDPNKKIFNSLKYASLISQIGISVIMPPLLCVFAAIWIRDFFNLSDIIVVIGIFLGVASGFLSLVNFMKMAVRDAKKSEEEHNEKYK